MRTPLLVPLLVVMLLLAACNRGEEAPGAIGADDQQQLNEAAAMLDANSVAIEEVTETETPARDANVSKAP